MVIPVFLGALQAEAEMYQTTTTVTKHVHLDSVKGLVMCQDGAKLERKVEGKQFRRVHSAQYIVKMKCCANHMSAPNQQKNAV